MAVLSENHPARLLDNIYDLPDVILHMSNIVTM